MIPLTQAFREEKDPSNLFLNIPTEIHWNKEGHIVVERALRQELLTKLPDLQNLLFNSKERTFSIKMSLGNSRRGKTYIPMNV